MATSTLRSDKPEYSPLFNYKAVIITYTASANISAGTPVIADDTGELVAMAFGDEVTGIALDSVNAGQSLRVLIRGVIESPLTDFLGNGTELFTTGADYTTDPTQNAVYTDTPTGTPARVGRNLYVRLANGTRVPVLVFDQFINSGTDELLTPA